MESIDIQAGPPAPGTVRIECIDYSPSQCTTTDGSDLVSFLQTPRPAWATVRWINVYGIDAYVVDTLRKHYGIHTLAGEDVLNTSQRPKLEEYHEHLFSVLRMVHLKDGSLANNQVSFFLFSDTLISIHEETSDPWDPIRTRMQDPQSRLRQNGTSYLYYTLCDSVVDHLFPVLEAYGTRLEELEDALLENAAPALQHDIHQIRRELAEVRRVLWPTRDVINHLIRQDVSTLDDYTRTYMRDVYDHAVRAIDLVETYREAAGSLNELYVSIVSNRMNEVMKVLTIMASLFIPITFLAGVYGMNFEYLPELRWKYSYAAFWTVCIVTVVSLVFYFRRKGWLGGDPPGDRGGRPD